MSTFKKTTKHPVRGDWQYATWYDDMFGNHNYGVVFPSDERQHGEDTPLKSVAFDPRKVDLEIKEEITTPTPNNKVEEMVEEFKRKSENWHRLTSSFTALKIMQTNLVEKSLLSYGSECEQVGRDMAVDYIEKKGHWVLNDLELKGVFSNARNIKE